MSLRHFNKVKKHRQRLAFALKVDGDSDIRLVVRRGPGISGEAKLAIVFLLYSGFFFLLILSVFTFSIVEMRLRTRKKTLLTSLDRVSAEGM